MLQKPLDNSGGRIHLSRAPGLGIDMDMDYLRGNALDGFDDSRRQGRRTVRPEEAGAIWLKHSREASKMNAAGWRGARRRS